MECDKSAGKSFQICAEKLVQSHILKLGFTANPGIYVLRVFQEGVILLGVHFSCLQKCKRKLFVEEKEGAFGIIRTITFLSMWKCSDLIYLLNWLPSFWPFVNYFHIYFILTFLFYLFMYVQ